MRIFLTFTALVLFIAGLTYFYKPGLIIKINGLMRKFFFDDAKVLLNRKKTGMFYIVMALIVFYGSFCLHFSPFNQNLKNELYQGWYYYYQGEFEKAKVLSEHVLQIDPDNQVAMEQLALIYFIKGDYKNADNLCKKILAKNSSNKRVKNIYDIIVKKRKK